MFILKQLLLIFCPGSYLDFNVKSRSVPVCPSGPEAEVPQAIIIIFIQFYFPLV